MKKLMMIALAAVIAAPALAYDSLEDLMKDNAKKQAELLKTYIAEHPKADDVKMAESQLVRNLMASEQQAEVIKLLEKKYESLMADKKNTTTRDVMGGCVMPLLSAHLDAGNKDAVKTWIARVEKDFADSEDIGQIKKALGQFAGRLNTPSVGDAMEIKVKALDGKEIDLSAMKDKIVLVDFWATWCGPCIQELPNVKKAYATYHDKGFEIVGISLDDDKAKLEAFLKKDPAMTWPQSCSGDGWDDATTRKYGITGIPAMFLIGKDGKVAAVSPRGPGVLEKKLTELLK